MSFEAETFQVATEQSLPVALVRAFCEVESAFNPWAVRYEPGYRWLVGNEVDLTATERTMQMTSWGLMQVMGAVAREHGFTGPIPQLCDPIIGLRYGCLHLNKLHARYVLWPDTIAAYNAGTPRMVQGQYVNQTYVDRVDAAWKRNDATAEL